MNNISISKCVNGAWDLTTKNWIMCIIYLVGLIIVWFVNKIGAPMATLTDMNNGSPEEMIAAYAAMFSGGMILSTIIAGILQYILYAGLYKMGLNAYNGIKVDTSAFRMPVMTYVKFVIGTLVYSIITAIGAVFCIIPGIIIGTRFLFVPYILLDEPETELVDAFKKSWAMTSGNFWNLILLYIVMFLINLVGFICCCVGLIFTGVMVVFMTVIAYYQLKDNSVAGPESFDTI